MSRIGLAAKPRPDGGVRIFVVDANAVIPRTVATIEYTPELAAGLVSQILSAMNGVGSDADLPEVDQ